MDKNQDQEKSISLPLSINRLMITLKDKSKDGYGNFLKWIRDDKPLEYYQEKEAVITKQDTRS